MFASALLALGALPLIQAQFVPPPPPVLLNSTKSGVLPVLPTPFNGTLTLEGAIISKAAANASYTPVLGPAPVQTSQPAAATYMATLPAIPFDGLTGTTIRGTVMAMTNGSTGVTFRLNLTGFPNVTQYGPFGYHVHNMPVPADGNCTSTMGHFDPTNAGEYYRCAGSLGFPQNCQAGDLAGKHGMINATSINTTYVENYLSLDPSSPYFFGNLSIVFHTSNTTRLTCANFMRVTGANGTTPAGSNSTTVPFTGAAAGKSAVGTASVLVAAMLFGLFML